MVYGVTFGDKHSYKDWKLLLGSRPEVSPPLPKFNYIDIPGGDGILDLTEALTGDIQYQTRKLEFTFLTLKARRKWHSLYSELQGCLHGERMKVILDEDPAFYYIGRVKVDKWKSSEKFSTIVVSAEVDPYKYELASSLEDWEWDSFNFEEGIIREYKGLEVDGSLDFTVPGRRKKVIPSFIVVSEDGAGLDVEFEGSTYHLPDGTDRVLNIAIGEGCGLLHFTGHGTVDIDYRGGKL